MGREGPENVWQVDAIMRLILDHPKRTQPLNLMGVRVVPGSDRFLTTERIVIELGQLSGGQQKRIEKSIAQVTLQHIVDPIYAVNQVIGDMLDQLYGGDGA